jgi:5'-nucleotidase
MRVLITNDDGFGAPGIVALTRAVREAGHEALVAAPAEEASGMSAALTAVTVGGRIAVTRHPDGYAVAASPAYIVMLAAHGAFGPSPDVVLSGINRGANAGNAVLHSGTVGAALTAAANGLPAISVSLDVLTTTRGSAEIVVPPDDALHWATAAEMAVALLDEAVASPAGTILNLNVPDVPAPPPLRTASLAAGGQARMTVAEAGDDFLRTVFLPVTDEPAPGTDLATLARGYATLTVVTPPAVPRQRLPRD